MKSFLRYLRAGVLDDTVFKQVLGSPLVLLVEDFSYFFKMVVDHHMAYMRRQQQPDNFGDLPKRHVCC